MPELNGESVCLCGANRISFSGDIVTKFRCHCKDELRLTGNGFSNNFLLPASNLKVVSGNLTTSARKANSGNTITTHFCGECGSLLYRVSDGFPDVIVIKAGCIDDGGKANAEYVPDVELFTASRASWLPAVETAIQEEGNFSEKSMGAF